MPINIRTVFIGDIKDDDERGQICSFLDEMNVESEKEFLEYHGEKAGLILPPPENSFKYLSRYHSSGLTIATDLTTKKTVGLIIVEKDYEIVSINIKKIYVTEQYRQKGIARALYHHVNKMLNPNGIIPIMLSVAIHNKKAIKFYESLGFRTMAQKMFLI